jgi:hydroxypyruvate isomerase
MLCIDSPFLDLFPRSSASGFRFVEYLFPYEHAPARIASVQIADSCGWHQPGTGEINYRYLFGFLDRTGYTGCVGLEYTPEGTTGQSPDWV